MISSVRMHFHAATEINLRRHWRQVAAAAPHRRGRGRCRVAVSAWNRQSPVVAVPLKPAPEPPARADNSLLIILGLAAAAAALLWQRLKQSGGGGGVPESLPGVMGLAPPGQLRRGPPSEADAKEYRMALARTRQATAVHRAIGFMNAGSSTRAMVELRRALHENSVCRAPLLTKSHSRKELESLYRLHLQNAEVPSDFATLLQLRSLLELDFEEAERIEAEVMQQGTAYSI